MIYEFGIIDSNKTEDSEDRGLRPFQTAMDSVALEKAATGLPILIHQHRQYRQCEICQHWNRAKRPRVDCITGPFRNWRSTGGK
ncbi:unnamed protein product [Cylicocyclus nassatus]|uniref:Uncharacterized protein n=1 Tax=Cylicocyclus nassatus TaxID=53992 RepID=A0AA36M0U5_CYLNA|nr:unnamed protein product [Cylicocyclus nassatus]